MDIESRMSDFAAGYIIAGGNLDEARDAAAQFVACLWSKNYSEAMTDPAVKVVVSALMECVPRDMESDSWKTLMQEPKYIAAFRWLEGEGLVRQSSKGRLVLSAKYYSIAEDYS